MVVQYFLVAHCEISHLSLIFSRYAPSPKNEKQGHDLVVYLYYGTSLESVAVI